MSKNTINNLSYIMMIIIIIITWLLFGKLLANFNIKVIRFPSLIIYVILTVLYIHYFNEMKSFFYNFLEAKFGEKSKT